MELSPEVGELSHLEVLDLEGTEIINLPATVGKLANLRCLKVSFYGYNNCNTKNSQLDGAIPKNVISSLLQLEELSIDVNPDDERWNVTVKDIVKEVCCLKRLEALKLYLPEVVVLNDLCNRSSSIDLSGMHFRFTVGIHLKRIISRLPHEVAVKFEEEERCLKYVNGKGIPTEIEEVLQHVTSLFLDRHLTVTSLSEFDIGNTKNLKFCVFGECDEIQTIVDADDNEVVLSSLEYLNLHYMKNLKCIWNGPLGSGSLSNLKALVMCSCPRLTTIFTLNLLENLNNLEELVVEDCPGISSIVTHEVSSEDLSQLIGSLPNLKKMSLHYMPKLVSISGGILVALGLEWLSIYDCPNLKTLSPEEVSSYNLKVIIGEADWWSTLKWETPEWFQPSNLDPSFGLRSTMGWDTSEWFQPPNLDSIFIPIERDKDLTTQLEEINDQLQARMQKTKPFQQSGSGTSSKQKQAA